MGPSGGVRRPELVVAISAAVIVLLSVIAYSSVVRVGDVRAPFAPAYPHPANGVETVLDAFDGQASASLAMDPTLSRPDTWVNGPEEAAYRAARPVFGWLAFLGSAGQPGAVAWVLVLLTALGAGVLLYGTARLAARFGREPTNALLLLATPFGLTAAFAVGMSDAFGTGLALLALDRWLDGRRGRALALFSVAALCRETLLLIPLAIALWELARRTQLTRVLVLATPALAYVAWLVVVKIRIGFLPSDFQTFDNLGPPMRGFVRAAREPWPLFEWAWFASGVVLVVLGLRRRLHPIVPWIAGAHLVFMTVLGGAVWHSGFDWGRVLLPVVAICVVALLRPRPAVSAAPVALST